MTTADLLPRLAPIVRQRGPAPSVLRSTRRSTLPNVALHEPRPYPLAPVLERFDPGPRRLDEPGAHGCLELHLRDAFGLGRTVAHSRIRRWEAGGLTERQADALATSMGLHPCALWPEWWGSADG